MDVLNYWAFVPEAWLVMGLVLVIADVFLGFNFFILPIGIAALILAGVIYGDREGFFGDVIFFETWRSVLICFSVLSVLSVGLLKWIFQRGATSGPDVNEY